MILGKFTKRNIYAYNIILVFLRVSAYDVHFMILAKKQKNKKKYAYENVFLLRIYCVLYEYMDFNNIHTTHTHTYN